MKCLFFMEQELPSLFWIFSTPKEDNPVPVIFGPRKIQNKNKPKRLSYKVRTSF